MKNIIYIATLCFTLACSSCDRDSLYYATEEQGFVRLNINWEPSQLEPNGTSAYAVSYTHLTLPTKLEV